MRKVEFSEYGDPQVLVVAEAAEPHAGPGQVRIAVRAAGVNAMDWKLRAGLLKDMMPLELPAGTGFDAAGVVDEIGDGTSDVTIGDEVFGFGTATYADYAVLTSWALKPAGLSFEEAAGYPVPVETALRILDQVGVQSGQTLLVSGAAGGVGSAVVQFARARGITVIGTAGAANQDYLRSLGATATVYGDGLVERVRGLAPAGVDAALDITGAGVVADLIELTGDASKVVSIADFGAAEKGARVSTTQQDPAAAFGQAARSFQAGELRLRVERAFSLDEAGAAQAASASGHVAGRYVIKVS